MPGGEQTPYVVEKELVIVGLRQSWALFAEVARLFRSSIDGARQDHLHASVICAYPCGQRERVLLAGPIDIGQDHVDHQPAAAAREKRPRFVGVGGLDYSISAL